MSIFYYDTKKIYASRFDALVNSTEIHNLRFYYYDNIFSQFDWSVEPRESLSQLYRERAEYIRDNFDYIVLCYSGGIDSTNVLETFYYNNIHIDEILISGAFSQDKNSDSDENCNIEIYKNAFPLLNKLNLRDTVINVIDYTKHFDDPNEFSLLHRGDDWSRVIGTHLSPRFLFWADVHKYINNKSDCKVGIIFGIEKPILNFGKIVSTKFYDTGCMSYGRNNTLSPINGITSINFYTDSNTPRLISKQCHLIKKVYENSSNKTWFRRNYTLIIEKIVYNVKNKPQYKSPKSTNFLLSNRDHYMMNNRNEEIFKEYSAGIDYIKKTTKIDSFLNTSINSREYKIG